MTRWPLPPALRALGGWFVLTFLIFAAVGRDASADDAWTDWQSVLSTDGGGIDFRYKRGSFAYAKDQRQFVYQFRNRFPASVKFEFSVFAESDHGKGDMRLTTRLDAGQESSTAGAWIIGWRIVRAEVSLMAEDAPHRPGPASSAPAPDAGLPTDPLPRASTRMGEAAARKRLAEAGIVVNKLPLQPNESFGVRPRDPLRGTEVGDVKRETIDALIAFKKACDADGSAPCRVVVTGGSEVPVAKKDAHEIATKNSHFSGDKLDIADEPSVRRFVESKLVRVGSRLHAGRCEAIWQDPVRPACWAHERPGGAGDHWDVGFGSECVPSGACK